MIASLPSWSSASLHASTDPRASPSGFSWVVIRKRSLARIASAACSRSVVVWRELIDKSRHPDATLDRRIVLKGQLGGPLHPELARDVPLEQAVRGTQALQRLLALLLRAEDADEDARVAEIGGGLDGGDRDEPDPGILELDERLRQDLLDCGVHPPHAVSRQASPPPSRRARARKPALRDTAPRRRGAPRPPGTPAIRMRASAVRAARARGGRPRRPTRRNAAGVAPSPRAAPCACP